MRLWKPASLTSSLLAIFILTAIAAVILMASLFSRGLGSQWQRAIVPHLYQYVAYIRNDLGSPPDESRARFLATRLPIQIQVHSLESKSMIFTTRDRPLPVGQVRFFTPRAIRQRQKILSGSGHDSSFDNIGISDDRGNPILRLDVDDSRLYIEFSRPRGREHGLDEMLLAIAGLALLLGLCYLSIRHLFKPIGQLQNTVQKIGDGDLTARTHAHGNNDLAKLANSVDQMSERIQQMLDAKRELLLAISHELRSPLTRARLATEMLEPSRHQSRLVRNIDEMDNLIAALVESERLQTHVVLDLQLVSVSRIVAEAVYSFEEPIVWENSDDPCIITADAARLHVLVRNLIANAIQYGKSPGLDVAEVEVRLIRTEKLMQVIVTDRGPGIEAESMASITEPFYRPDASRTRSTGGMGLGLYLCQKIAEAHSGKLLIESSQSDGSGVRATVSLPIGPEHDKSKV